MANSAAETLKEFKSASTASNAVYATLKVQYTGSWMDDIQQISTMCGVPVRTLLQLNPWLTSNNFVANNHDSITMVHRELAEAMHRTASLVFTVQMNGFIRLALERGTAPQLSARNTLVLTLPQALPVR